MKEDNRNKEGGMNKGVRERKKVVKERKGAANGTETEVTGKKEKPKTHREGNENQK